MSHKIDIVENGTTTLLTAGKFCDRNIDINVNVESSGGTEIEDAFITGTLSGDYRNDRVTTVGQYGLYYKKNLVNIDLPSVVSIGDYAMANCHSLISINIPNIETIGTSAFSSCWSLSSINLETVKKISTNAFSGCWKFPSTISLPLLTYIDARAFQNCRLLSRADFPLATTIQSQAFESCYSLTKLILRSPTLCRLASTTAFNYCYHILGTVDSTYNPEGLKDGYIYVPKNLIEQYKVETNWVTYADQFRAIEDYPEITGG